MLSKAFETPYNAIEWPGSPGTCECHEEELQIWTLYLLRVAHGCCHDMGAAADVL